MSTATAGQVQQQKVISRKAFDLMTRRGLYTLGELYGYIPSEEDVAEFRELQIATGRYRIIEENAA